MAAALALSCLRASAVVHLLLRMPTADELASVLRARIPGVAHVVRLTVVSSYQL